jgi:hypothetical protein
MSDLNLGRIIEPGEVVDRDAIHVAVAPVVAEKYLRPGWHVGLKNGLATDEASPPIGIVDPFLEEGVAPRQKFWLFLYPKTITNLRHHWTHPSFEPEPAPVNPDEQSPSERWLRAFAERVGLGYFDLMSGAGQWIQQGEHLCRGGLLEGQYVPDEFWVHYEAVTGDKGEGSFFTCSC